MVAIQDFRKILQGKYGSSKDMQICLYSKTFRTIYYKTKQYLLKLFTNIWIKMFLKFHIWPKWCPESDVAIATSDNLDAKLPSIFFNKFSEKLPIFVIVALKLK